MFTREIFRKKWKDFISERIWTVNLLDTNQRKVIKGEISLRYCRRHDTIIICFDFDGFHRTHIRLLAEKFNYE